MFWLYGIFVQIFETNGHHSSLKTSIGISKVRFTSNRKFRFSSGVRFDADVITKGAETANTEVTANGKDMTARKKFFLPNKNNNKMRDVVMFDTN